MKRSLLAKLIAVANTQKAIDFGILPSVGFSDCHPFTIDAYFDYMSLYIPFSVELATEPMKHHSVMPSAIGSRKVVVACASSMQDVNKFCRIGVVVKRDNKKLNRTKRGGKRTVHLNDWQTDCWSVGDVL